MARALKRAEDLRAIAEPSERAQRAGELLRALEVEAEAAREIRDDAMLDILKPPYGRGTMGLAEGARLIGVTRGLMPGYFAPDAVKNRRAKKQAAAATA